MAKPQYIQDLELKIARIEQIQKEQGKNQDNLMVAQGEMLNRVMQIHVCLMGTEYEQSCNGGMVSDVNKLKIDVKSLKTWRTRIVAVGSTISAILSALWLALLMRWNEIKELV